MSARARHSEAALRRLELLSAELSGLRLHAVPPLPDEYDDLEEPDTSYSPEPGQPEPNDPSLPVPGRHAARLIEPSRRRIALPSMPAPQVAVVLIVLAAALLLGAWWVVRSGSEGVVVPATPASVPGLLTPGAAPGQQGEGAEPAGVVVVDVAGRVRHPGIVVLKLGSRVVDALKAAGGVRRGVDLATINQARLLVDGEQILVGVDPVGGVAAGAASGAGGSGTLINLNTADQTLLETLPGVGPVTAQSILSWRTANGRFSSVDELLEVDGIGDATLAQIAPFVTI